jgi:hypothetical protein
MHTASCHCGDVRIDIDAKIESLIECNCSICSRKSPLLFFVPRESATLRTDRRALSSYRFNKHVIEHLFCSRCGCSPFAEGVGPDGKAMTAVNARCIEGLSLDGIPVHHYDGRSA